MKQKKTHAWLQRAMHRLWGSTPFDRLWLTAVGRRTRNLLVVARNLFALRRSIFKTLGSMWKAATGGTGGDDSRGKHLASGRTDAEADASPERHSGHAGHAGLGKDHRGAPGPSSPPSMPRSPQNRDRQNPGARVMRQVLARPRRVTLLYYSQA